MAVIKVVLLALTLLVAACRKEQVAVIPPDPPPLRTATMSIIVPQTPDAVEQVIAAAEANGGTVTHANVWRDGSHLRATLTLHIPPVKLTATLAAVRRTASSVEEETIAER